MKNNIHFKNEATLNQFKIFQFGKKRRRKIGKFMKEDNKDQGIKLENSNFTAVSRLSNDIVNKIRKLLVRKVKEINKISDKISRSDEENKDLILFPTLNFENDFRKENSETKKLNHTLKINETKICQNEEKKLQENSDIKTVPEVKIKKNSSLELSNDQKTQNEQISMTKLSRNGGIENNFSRKEIGKPSWRNKLLDTKQKTKEATSSENTIYLKMFSSLKDSEPNSTKLDQEFSTPKSRVQQLSEAFDIELNKKTKEQKRIIEINQSRTKGGTIEPREEDLIEAANFGMQAMNDLYYIKEPKFHSLGLFLSPNNPAHFVASFNEQTEEAKYLTRFGFAALQGSILFVNKYPEISRNTPFTVNTTNSSLHRQCPKRGIPQCPSASMRYRTADGSCNNAQNLWWGSAMSTMQRFLPPLYQDGIQSIRRSVNGDLLPSAREVSNLIHEDRDIPLASISHMLMQWGQFVDHDISATVPSRGFNGTIPQCCLDHGTGFQPPEFMHPECLPIAVHPRDNFFSQFAVRCLEFLRNGPAPRENCEFGPREQVSQVTSYLDASTIYGSNVIHSDSMRIFRDGLLQYGKLQSRRTIETRDDNDICQLGSLSQSCFITGDGRVGENPALTSLHVVFLRLHNRFAKQIAELNPHWSEEKMFQETRKIVGAIIQHITYREFLPIVLGQDVMKIFKLEIMRNGYSDEYDPDVNPNVANEFITAAFRFGHSLVQPSFVRFDKKHRPLFNNVSIHEEFVNPHLHSAGSLEKIILGLVNQPSQKRDEYISEELTNHLFQRELFPFGMDLAAINIQRGRDHGLPPYIQYRSICGLSEINNWEDLDRVMEISTARKFKFLYSSIEDIDLFSAGLAEKSVGGGLVGPTFACIIAQQFSNLKKGDRFWFENSNMENKFTPQQLQQIRSITLTKVLCKTMDNIESLQPFIMQLPDNFKNKRIFCNDSKIGDINVTAWLELTPESVNKSEIEIKSSLLNDAENISEGIGELENLKKNSERFQETVKDFQKEVEDSIENVDFQKHIDDLRENMGTSQEIVYRSRGSISKPETKNKGEEKLRQSLRPLQTSVNQQNRIVLKRPIAPQENISIVVHNVAVNAPIFVRDSVYGSHVNQNPHSSTQFSVHEPFFNTMKPQTYPNKRPPFSKPMKPSYINSSPYIPQYFGDTSNPNPPTYGFNHNPINNYIPNNAFFENMYNNNYRPYEEKPNYNQESFIKLVTETPDYSSNRFLQNSWNFKPDSQSFTVVSETLETVNITETMKPTSKRKYGGELPKPLIPRQRTNDDFAIEQSGLHYFEKNILNKYPETVMSQTTEKIGEKELKPSKYFDDDKEVRLKNQSEAVNYTIELNLANASKIIDDIKFTTTPTIVLKNGDINPFITIPKSQQEKKNQREDGI
ncbi:uncharacterized protein LOC127282981 isoform X2 [Leptopilina boulardi]|nr:uncharacterized protein LOC127282981 isoform X2 [Leptopilina boulardi]